jgi:hypothetical protein
MVDIPGKLSGPLDVVKKPMQIENPVTSMLEKRMKDPKQLPEMMKKIEDITNAYVRVEGAADKYRGKVTGTLAEYFKEGNMGLGVFIGAVIGAVGSIGYGIVTNYSQIVTVAVAGGIAGVVAGMYIGMYFDYRDAEKMYKALKEAGIVKE